MCGYDSAASAGILARLSRSYAGLDGEDDAASERRGNERGVRFGAKLFRREMSMSIQPVQPRPCRLYLSVDERLLTRRR